MDFIIKLCTHNTILLLFCNTVFFKPFLRWNSEASTHAETMCSFMTTNIITPINHQVVMAIIATLLNTFWASYLTIGVQINSISICNLITSQAALASVNVCSYIEVLPGVPPFGGVPSGLLPPPVGGFGFSGLARALAPCRMPGITASRAGVTGVERL